MTTLVNLTPHDLDLYFLNAPDVVGPEDKPWITIKKSGIVCRLATEEGSEKFMLSGIPIAEVRYGVLTGLPEPKDDTLYIVALPCVAAALSLGRTDILTSDRQVRIRREDGTAGAVVGCRRLGMAIR